MPDERRTLVDSSPSKDIYMQSRRADQMGRKAIIILNFELT